MTALDLTDVLNRLERGTFIRRTEWHDELDSTNTFAASLASQVPLDLPYLIGAVRQTAGRGRGQNAWWSSPGALTFSLLLNPLDYGLPFVRWPQVALMTGLAVAETLEHFLPPSAVQLKWPNDVYAAGRKICGILTEVPGGRSDRLVVGIGLNVGNTLADAPADIQATAVSLRDLLGESHPPLGLVLTTLISRWEAWFQRLVAQQIDFPSLWQTKCYLTGARVCVTVGPDLRSGICRGLDRDGALLIETPAGIERILAGTVRKY